MFDHIDPDNPRLEYVRQMLTEANIADAVEGLRRDIYRPDEMSQGELLNRVHNIALKVDRFNNGGTEDGTAGHWLALGVDILTEFTDLSHWGQHYNGAPWHTRAELVDLVEEEFTDDEDRDEDLPVWEVDCREKVREWLNVDAYTLWRMVSITNLHTIQHCKEFVFHMARDSHNGNDIAEVARDTFQDAVERWGKKYDETRAAA